MPAKQGNWFILTIPHEHFLPYLPPGIRYIRGQLERGTTTDFLHWQLVLYTERKSTITSVRTILGPYHAELTRSAAALSYVWKQDTAIPNTTFELGIFPSKRNVTHDWDRIWTAATRADYGAIPADVRVRHYSTIRKIASDHAVPESLNKEVFVFWGVTGSGKSHRAWNEAGLDAYAKDPRSKWWDGYKGQKHVVIDEFRGTIDIAHMLRWLDKFPCTVEIKGASVPLACTKLWITSNLSPDQWYPDLDAETKRALRRRLKVTHFSDPFNLRSITPEPVHPDHD